MIAAIVLALAGPAYEVNWTAPRVYVEGQPFPTHVEIVATGKADVPMWMFEAGAFTADGQPIAERKLKEKLPVDAGSKLGLDLDIGPAIAASKAAGKREFKLAYAGGDGKSVEVRVFVQAEKGLDFMDEKKMPADKLASYAVALETNRGTMVLELWPDVAPRHVRNFLDLAYSGFYDNTLFHRVMPGFMIQGGDPVTKEASRKGEWGTGQGPRQLKSEFNKKKHVRGVLSMARGDDPNSASCQFFVMDAAYPSLDGKYTAFGILVEGFEALDKIVHSPGDAGSDGSIRPAEPQRIVRARVLRSP